MPFLDKHGRERSGPDAVCNACYRFGWRMQIGRPCHWCSNGVFFSAAWFDFQPCSVCFDKYLGCDVCHGKGVHAVPRHDITQQQVDAELAEFEARNNRPPTPPAPAPASSYQWKGKKRTRRRR